MLDRLQPRARSTRGTKRIGRGRAGAGGKTGGRGHKGQGHRSAGRERPFHFEGGLPKRGFHNPERVTYQVVNLAALAALGDGATVDKEALVGRGLVSAQGPEVKILGEGEAPKSLTVRVKRISAGARKKIEEAGGSVELV
jgi:large subunit ribosomal protein L15